MMVWMVVGTVNTVDVVDDTPDFPWFSFGPPVWVGAPSCLFPLPS